MTGVYTRVLKQRSVTRVRVNNEQSPCFTGRSQWTERNRDVRLEATKHLHQTPNLARRRGLAGFKIALNA